MLASRARVLLLMTVMYRPVEDINLGGPVLRHRMAWNFASAEPKGRA